MTAVTYDDTLYRSALARTLVSSPSKDQHSKTFRNKTRLPMCITALDAAGRQGVGFNLGHDQSTPDDFTTNLDVYYVITNALTGAFVAAVQTSKDRDHYTFHDNNLVFHPNEIGMPPLASPPDIIIPSNSWSVVVGFSSKQTGTQKTKDSNGKTKEQSIQYIVVREQSWDMSGTSYSLGPFETKRVSVTHQVGREDKSSTVTSISSSVGFNASAGWGPIAASVSASLSQTSTISHDVLLRESETSFVEQTLKNESPSGMIVYFWKLMDHITWYQLDDSGTAAQVLASVTIPIGPMVPIGYSVSGNRIKRLDDDSGNLLTRA